MSTTEPAAVPGWPWPRFFRYVYAAKFLCGELKRTAAAAPEGPVEPGSYATAINLHNPHGYPVGIRKKAILLYDGSHPEEAVERPVPPVHPQSPVMKELGPDYGLEIDCRDIREVLLSPAPGTTFTAPATFTISASSGWSGVSVRSRRPQALNSSIMAGPDGVKIARGASNIAREFAGTRASPRCSARGATAVFITVPIAIP